MTPEVKALVKLKKNLDAAGLEMDRIYQTLCDRMAFRSPGEQISIGKYALSVQKMRGLIEAEIGRLVSA